MLHATGRNKKIVPFLNSFTSNEILGRPCICNKFLDLTLSKTYLEKSYLQNNLEFQMSTLGGLENVNVVQI